MFRLYAFRFNSVKLFFLRPSLFFKLSHCLRGVEYIQPISPNNEHFLILERLAFKRIAMRCVDELPAFREWAFLLLPNRRIFFCRFQSSLMVKKVSIGCSVISQVQFNRLRPAPDHSRTRMMTIKRIHLGSRAYGTLGKSITNICTLFSHQLRSRNQLNMYVHNVMQWILIQSGLNELYALHTYLSRVTTFNHQKVGPTAYSHRLLSSLGMGGWVVRLLEHLPFHSRFFCDIELNLIHTDRSLTPRSLQFASRVFGKLRKRAISIAIASSIGTERCLRSRWIHCTLIATEN